MQQEIQRAEVRQLETLDFAFADSFEMVFHARRGNFAGEHRIKVFTQRDYADVRRVAFVARARVRDFRQLDLHSDFLNRLFPLELRFRSWESAPASKRQSLQPLAGLLQNP